MIVRVAISSVLILLGFAAPATAAPMRENVGPPTGDTSELVPVPILPPEEIERRLSAAQGQGLPGIPVTDAYVWLPEDQVENRDSRGVALCVFYTDGDYVHKSGGWASAHGWWKNINCPSSTRANTHIDLVEKLFGNWMIVGAGDATNKPPGSGSGIWATAKSSCVDNTLSLYYSLITVDLIGRSEPNQTTYTATRELACL